jgi:hypothetical protein
MNPHLLETPKAPHPIAEYGKSPAPNSNRRNRGASSDLNKSSLGQLGGDDNIPYGEFHNAFIAIGRELLFENQTQNSHDVAAMSVVVNRGTTSSSCETEVAAKDVVNRSTSSTTRCARCYPFDNTFLSNMNVKTQESVFITIDLLDDYYHNRRRGFVNFSRGQFAVAVLNSNFDIFVTYGNDNLAQFFCYNDEVVGKLLRNMSFLPKHVKSVSVEICGERKSSGFLLPGKFLSECILYFITYKAPIGPFTSRSSEDEN